jgi:uncharacterized membrane protein YfcA
VLDSSRGALATSRYVHRMSWQWPAGAACGFLIALSQTPAGVSGAVLLLPVQLSVLRVGGHHSPAGLDDE